MCRPTSCLLRSALLPCWLVMLCSLSGWGQTRVADAGGDAGVSGKRTIALTFDDLPMTVVGNDHVAGPLAETRFIMTSMLRVLQAHHAVALGLVNEVKLNVPGERDARAGLLEAWLAGGMQLGNHGYSHRAFSELTEERYEAEFLRGDVITVPLLETHGQAERYFRPPYLDGGDTRTKTAAFASFLAAHGYRMAPFTIQNDDWMFNASYDEARRRHDVRAMARVRAAYLAHVTEEFDHAEAQTLELFRRQISQVMFMHTDVLNADALDAVLRLMEARGYRFVAMSDALRDPAYETREGFVGSAGSSWLDRWQLGMERGKKTPEPPVPAWVRENYTRITTPAQR